ncbi:hypothetical protein [Humibacillus sp. DSM 29435]|uniref:hypothetical protein n=1 Tax=Humibacillus sp. DSM 29435 TaxID=1869167 RepID=UPI0011131A2B|nr:hypothetical protein [Humibacillus sp. DSM 29435]
MKTRSIAAGALALAAVGTGFASASSAGASGPHTSFTMQRSPGIVAARCLPQAKARVTVTHDGPVERMRIQAWGLAKNTDFDTFVIQVPNAPFGVSWYQGDLESNGLGKADVEYVGRFSQETFAIAPGVAPAPSVHSTPTPDATTNPAFGPVHTFHVGIWFNNPADALKAGCPGATTPFNGEHNAGVQVLNTGSFADTDGPLGRFRP